MNLSLHNELLLQAVLDGKAEPTRDLVREMYEGLTAWEKEVKDLKAEFKNETEELLVKIEELECEIDDLKGLR